MRGAPLADMRLKGVAYSVIPDIPLLIPVVSREGGDVLAQESRPDRSIWQSYPSWRQFTWLYLFSILTALRGALFMAFGLPGGEMWLIGAFLLLACVAGIRRWARYEITQTKVTIRNGYTGREITSIPVAKIQEIRVTQGPIAGFFGIGTVVVKGADGERQLRFRGITDPEVVERRIEALRPALSVGV